MAVFVAQQQQSLFVASIEARGFCQSRRLLSATPGQKRRGPGLAVVVAATAAASTLQQESWTNLLSRPLVESPTKGWSDGKLIARLRLLQSIASDRKEMHAALAQQRDGWNKLFQTSLGAATLSAAVLASVGAGPCSAMLNVAAGLFMALVNKFQPSQLAEEQRTASRLYGVVCHEIESCLAVDARYREYATAFLDDKIRRLHALDAAFPMPLTPGGLPKFPTRVAASELGALYNLDGPLLRLAPSSIQTNGWTSGIEEDLLSVSRLLQEKDVPNYLSMARVMLKLNKVLAVAAPFMAMVAAVTAAAGAQPVVAGALSIAAFIARCLSHDIQVGMVFEMYRNCAGYYTYADASIQRTLRMPAEMREDGELFHQRISHLIGRRDELPCVPAGSKGAGTLF